jgi:mRNA interferase RelE/StbE
LGEYRIFETEGFLADLRKIARAAGAGVERKLREHVYPLLRKEPHFGPSVRKLRGWTPETWRIRIRDWRFFYQIDEGDKLVSLTAAHHRREAYD